MFNKILFIVICLVSVGVVSGDENLIKNGDFSEKPEPIYIDKYYKSLIKKSGWDFELVLPLVYPCPVFIPNLGCAKVRHLFEKVDNNQNGVLFISTGKQHAHFYISAILKPRIKYKLSLKIKGKGSVIFVSYLPTNAKKHLKTNILNLYRCGKITEKWQVINTEFSLDYNWLTQNSALALVVQPESEVLLDDISLTAVD